MRRLKCKYYISLFILGIIFASCGSNSKVTTERVEGSLHIPSLSDKENTKLQYLFFNANKEKILGNMEKAGALFEQCIKIDPQNSASYFELALIYEASQEYGLALRSAQKAAEIDSENPWYQIVLAGMYENAKQFSTAAAIYEKLVAKNPNDLDNYYYWINTLIYSNDLKKAVSVYDLLEEKLGVTEEFSLRKQKIYLSLKDEASAIVEIEKLIETDPGNLKYLNILAELYQISGDFDKAEEIYNRILKSDPQNGMVHLALSEQYAKNGDTLKSAEEMRLVFEDENFNIDAKIRILLKNFTLSGVKEEKKKESIALGGILTRVHPKEPKAYSVYGDLLYRIDSLSQAREQYRKAITLDESKFVLWSQVLIIDSELSDFDAMYEESKKAVELFPAQPSFYLFQGMAGIQKKELKEAIEILNEGKELVFDNPPLLAQFYASLGDAYYKEEQHLKSDTAYDKSLEYDPDNIYVLNNYSYYLSLRKENLDKAEKMSKRSNELEPNSQSFADTYGWILYQMGNYTEAKEWIEKSIEYGGGSSPVILEHYGDVLYQLNDVDKAIETWKKAKELGVASDKLEEKIMKEKLVE